MAKLRTLLVDDNEPFLSSAAKLLATFDELELIGRAFSADEALEQIDKLHPDLVLMDMVMPGIGGLHATRLVKAGKSAPRVIIWSLHTDPGYRAAALQAGADGFITKSSLTRQLLPLVEALFPGLLSESVDRRANEEGKRGRKAKN